VLASRPESGQVLAPLRATASASVRLNSRDSIAETAGSSSKTTARIGLPIVTTTCRIGSITGRTSARIGRTTARTS
jgi:hypothetical protein